MPNNAVIDATEKDTIAHLVDRLATFYHSPYVKHNQPWILKTPFKQWLSKELTNRGIVL